MLREILDSAHTRRPIVMGILNVTPDSFSDGGRFDTPRAAVERARQMVADGADVIDVGAESTRPGSARVSDDEQIARLSPILPEICRMGVLVSIDTTRSAVANIGLRAGVAIVNDVSAGRDDPGLLALAGERGAAVVLMHMLGKPRTMQEDPHYEHVVAEVREFLADRIDQAVEAGVPRENCIVDPGIGFGKTVEHNLQLLAGVAELCELDRPVLIGASRKRFIGAISGQDDPDRRLGGSLAAVCAAYRRGATIFRVHDVSPTVQALAVLEHIERAGQAT